MLSRTAAADLRLRQVLSDRRTLLFLVGLGVLGIVLMVAGEHSSDARHPIWRALLLAWGGLFVATATVSLFWELWGKRAFSQEVLAAAGVAADTRKAGLTGINTEYLDIASWPQLFDDAPEIDLLVSWGATWRKAHEARWDDWIRRPGRRLRVLLPDISDTALLKHLGHRFDKDVGYVRSRVEETAEFYRELRKHAGSGTVVEVRFIARAPVWGYYRFGRTIVATLYPHSLASAPRVPAMIFRNDGEAGQFFVQQFARCWDEVENPLRKENDQ